LTKLRLNIVEEETCLFTNNWLIVFFFVDDIVTLCCTEDLPRLYRFRDALMDRYELRDLGQLSWFLGIRVLRDRSQRKLWLCQDSYIEKITKAFHLEDVKPARTPMATEELVLYDGKASPQDIYLYQQKVGSLLYATTITRPDRARAAAKLLEFLQNPSPHHQGAVDRAISYLYSMKTLAIEYSASTDS